MLEIYEKYKRRAAELMIVIVYKLQSWVWFVWIKIQEFYWVAIPKQVSVEANVLGNIYSRFLSKYK